MDARYHLQYYRYCPIKSTTTTTMMMMRSFLIPSTAALFLLIGPTTFTSGFAPPSSCHGVIIDTGNNNNYCRRRGRRVIVVKDGSSNSVTITASSSSTSTTSSSTCLYATDTAPEPLATEGEWSAYLDSESTGYIYYFNSVTGESTWEKPTPTFPTVTSSSSSSSSSSSTQQLHLSMIRAMEDFSLSAIMGRMATTENNHVVLGDRDIVLRNGRRKRIAHSLLVFYQSHSCLLLLRH